MDMETHLDKYKRRVKAASNHKSIDETSESILDDYRAAAGHLINAYLADRGIHEQNFDRLTRTIKANSYVFPNKSIADDLADVYENLKNLREKKDYSLEKVARLANLSLNTIVKIENGVNQNPTIRTLTKIAKALEVGVDDLIK